MRKTRHLFLCICMVFLLASCGGQNAGSAQPVQSAQASRQTTAAAVSPTPAQSTTPLPVQTVNASNDKRAWRHFVYIPTETTPETVMMQGDCKTTYTTVKAKGIKEAGLKAWLDGEIDAFTNGILQDESGIQKARQMFTYKGMDKVYPGSIFLRRVNVNAFSSGGVFSLLATDYTVFRPADADIQRDRLGWDNGQGGLSYFYENTFMHSDENGTTRYAGAYAYRIQTKCLNMIERRPMKLMDLLRGESGLQKLNVALSKWIQDMKLNEAEVLKRPFSGVGADHDCFCIQNYGPGGLTILIGFNEGNPWFNLEAPNWWCTYRMISPDQQGAGKMLAPILYDDTLLPKLDRLPAGESMYGTAQGEKYMPDLGLAEYAITNGKKQVRVTKLANSTVMEKINAGIAEFEGKYLNDAYIMDTLFFPEARVDPQSAGYRIETANKPGYSAYVQEIGNILEISYRISFNMRMAGLDVSFDLNTGKRLTARDLVKKAYFTTPEYEKISSKATDLVNLNRDGRVCLYYTADVKTEERAWMARIVSQECGQQYFDWEKWGKLK